MLISGLVALGLGIAMQADTVLVLGAVERDLTGDSKPEVLRLVAVGQSIDSLEVTFSIEGSGRVLFRARLAPLTRTVGFDAGRRVLSSAEHRARLDGFGARFFAENRFTRPDEFVAELRRQARLRVAQIPEVLARDRRRQIVIDSLMLAGHDLGSAERSAPSYLLRYGTPYDTAWAGRTWRAIQSAGVIVFRYSAGYDSVTAIAWSARDQRFYRLLECC